MDYKLMDSVLPQEQMMSAVERVMTNRGIPLNEVDHYLHTTESDILPPELIPNMMEGVVMLAKHIVANDDIFIQVDSDCDGYTSAACLINYLNISYPAFVQNHVSYRLHEDKRHGVLPETIAASVKLVIAPDSSSNDYEQHKELHERGIDVLVIDHHEADKISEYACIINNQLCDYPTKSLSGVGMVFKFCQFFDKVMNKNNANEFRDLVALGIIADMVDVRDFETRQLIATGLNHIRNPFMKQMVNHQDYCIQKDGGLHPHSVGFYISPFVNATTRFGTQDEKLLLFESMLEYKAYEQVQSTKRGAKKGQMETRVEKAVRTCGNIHNHQNKAKEEAQEILDRLIKEENLNDNKILMIKTRAEYGIERNTFGLVANQLAQKYQKPCAIVKECDDNFAKHFDGSARGYTYSPVRDFRKFVEDSGLSYLAQGHANAFGIGFFNGNYDEFIKWSNEQLKDVDCTPYIRCDFIWNNSNFMPQDISDIGLLHNIWGQELPEPFVAIENIKVHSGDCSILKGNTLKITLQNGVSLMKFKCSDEEVEMFSTIGDNSAITINVVGTCNANIWNGKVSPQLLIKDYEVVGAMEYYF